MLLFFLLLLFTQEVDGLWDDEWKRGGGIMMK